MSGVDLRGARVVVTGGAGTIGSHIVDELVHSGAADIVVVDNFVRGLHRNLAQAQARSAIAVVDGDIRDANLMRRVVDGADVVFHQAAIRITQCAEEPRLALEVLVNGTFNVLEAAVAAHVPKVVAASSASVYGQADAFPTGESQHPWHNDTFYGAAKAFNEGMLASFAAVNSLEYVALRYFNVYGPRMDAHGAYTEVLIRWMERIVADQPPLIFGDGSQTMDLVHVRDIARANVLAATAAASGVALNVGSGTEVSLRELAAALLRAMGSDLAVEHLPPRPVNGVTRRLADTRLARELIGFESEIGLDEGLRELVTWWRAQRSEPMSQRPPVRTVPVARPWLGDEEAEAAAEVVRSGWVAQGPRVAAFERDFAAAVGAGEGVAVSSCTAGLHLALVVLGARPGDEVVVPSLSFIATANAVRYVGATPVFADVDPVTANLTAKTVEAVLTPRTRVVMVVHQAGMPADLDELQALCDGAGIHLLEDAACAVGSTYRGRPVGAGPALAAWSLHPRKVITTGEGGVVTTVDASSAARLRRLREHGMSVSAADRHAAAAPVFEEYTETGFNYRMTDLQAAVGLVQLTRLPAIVARRRELAARYTDALSSIAGLQLPHDPPYGQTNHQSYWIVLPDDFPVTRDGLLRLLAHCGVSARRGIMAAHLEPAYGGRPRRDLPVTERLTARSLILPLYHAMTAAEQDRVVTAIHDGAVAS